MEKVGRRKLKNSYTVILFNNEESFNTLSSKVQYPITAYFTRNIMKNKFKDYDNHQSEWEKILIDPKRRLIGESWLRVGTLDHWRHNRMRDPIRTLINHDKNSSWLTIGDGRFGTDGHYLQKEGLKNVHCTDISDTLLKIGKKEGYIESFSVENAENIRFDDGDFDYVFCKEAFHHFPRPYIALHEMFRVSKKAVVMIEPRDQLIARPPFDFLMKCIRVIFKKNSLENTFEPVGNYVYSVSERELDKFMLGMHYQYVAYYGLNDCYINGVEFIDRNSKSIKDQFIKFKLKLKIISLNILTSLKITNSLLLISILFKEKPSETLISQLKKSGWKFKELPLNPYRK